MGIVVATTAGTLGCPSPALTTPSLGFSTPRTGTSTSGSPALSLSDDSAATTLNPIVVLEHVYEHSQSTSNSPAAGAQSSAPVPVPGAQGGGGGLGRSPPQVSTFPTATGGAGSPTKESSSLGRQEIAAEDLMEE